MTSLRIGVLGAARIAPAAIVKPARSAPDAEVVAVAARDRSRADAFAAKHGIPRVFDSYADLLANPGIDAIYNPLPNGLHAQWTIAALEACLGAMPAGEPLVRATRLALWPRLRAPAR